MEARADGHHGRHLRLQPRRHFAYACTGSRYRCSHPSSHDERVIEAATRVGRINAYAAGRYFRSPPRNPGRRATPSQDSQLMTSSFRAMDTDIVVLTTNLSARSERELVRRVADLFEQSEQRFSRFRPDSELSRLNRSGRLEHASAPFLAALDRASRFHHRTQGRFNPVVGGVLIDAGYDRSFSSGQMYWRPGRVEPRPTVGFDAVAVDRLSGYVTLPPGVALDFGGFIKGWTVDQAAGLLPTNAVLDAGGDALLRGAGPDGRGWIVDIEDPADAAREVMTLRVRDGAVATSAPNRRRWRTANGEMHHLIDPRTFRPADSDLAQVTVVGASVEESEVLAKSAFVAGLASGRRFLQQQPGIAAVLVSLDGRVDIVGNVEVDHAA